MSQEVLHLRSISHFSTGTRRWKSALACGSLMPIASLFSILSMCSLFCTFCRRTNRRLVLIHTCRVVQKCAVILSQYQTHRGTCRSRPCTDSQVPACLLSLAGECTQNCPPCLLIDQWPRSDKPFCYRSVLSLPRFRNPHRS